jgi:hypothetical protein
MAAHKGAACGENRWCVTPSPHFREAFVLVPGTEWVRSRQCQAPSGYARVSVMLTSRPVVTTDVPVRLGAGGGLTRTLAVADRLTCMRSVARRRFWSASVT